MEPQVSTSFIPKKPLTESRGRRGGMFGLILLLAILLFVGSLMSAGAAFLYGRYLNSALSSKSDSLQAAQNAYDQGVIEDLIRLDARIAQARTILGSHVTPSAVFFFLADQTLTKVRFTSFEYNLKEDGAATIRLDGQTDAFSTIALQSDQFGGGKVLKDIIFSNIGVAEGGGVTFTVEATVDPAFLLYSRNFATAPAAPAIEVVSEEPIEETEEEDVPPEELETI